jgi:hypothetical protein
MPIFHKIGEIYTSTLDYHFIQASAQVSVQV